MRAVVYEGKGGPEVVALRSVPEPTCGPDEVVVGVRATALNRADLLQRRGLYPAPPSAPRDIPGLEFAGEVEAVGDRVRRLRTGDRVMGIVPGGGHAEKVVLHERLCLEIPPRLDFERAAAVPEAFLTAFDGLLLQGGLGAGETVLVHAAGSGVGTAAVQVARAAGASVIALARTASKRRRLEGQGVLAVFDPSAPNLADRIRAAIGHRGIELILDLVGAAAWPLNLDVIGPRGRIVIVGLLGGARVRVDLARLLARRVTVRGSVLRSRDLEEKLGLVEAFRARMLPLLADGRLEPVVDRTLPLSAVADAHAVMEANGNFGKIVLTP